MNAVLRSHLSSSQSALWRSLDALQGRPWPYCITAFHRISDRFADELSYPVRAFAELCRYWRDHYEILNLDRLLARLAHGDAAHHPTLVITFDDGYADNAEVAAPILDALGLSATFFVTTGVMGSEHRFFWDQALAATPPLMNWNQVRELHAAGFGIGSHTVSHARLSVTRGAALEHELQASRSRLESELGAPVLDFAYPFGQAADCDGTARAAVARAGYRCCLSCHGGLVAAGDSPYTLQRISVSPKYHATPHDWARRYLRARHSAKRAA